MSFILAFQKELIWTKHLDFIYNQTSGTQSALENLWTPNKNPSPQKQWPIFLSLPGSVVLLTFRSQSRRGELNGINLNLRLHHPQSWSQGMWGTRVSGMLLPLVFSINSLRFYAYQTISVKTVQKSISDRAHQEGRCLSFVGLIPSIPHLSHSSTPKPDP